MIPDLPPGAVAVVFHSVRRGDAMADDDYAAVASRMDELASQQPGYLGIRSVRDRESGEGITVSYWRDEASARAWKSVPEHLQAQRRGREEWYAGYDVIVAEVIRAYRHP